MALAAAEEKVNQIEAKLDQQAQDHQAVIARIKAEAAALRKRIHVVTEMASCPVEIPKDTTFTRQVEWTLPNYMMEVKKTPKNKALWSPEFSAMGIQNMQLEFFPAGRNATQLDGFCAVFLWCPAGVHLKYRLRVGNHWSAPDTDEYLERMGHGHSNFCYLDAQKNTDDDTIVVGAEILSLSIISTIPEGLKFINEAPEAVVAREACLLANRHMEGVEWVIKNIRKKMNKLPRGLAIYSPRFSICGVREMFLEFYPNGVESDKEVKDGFCGFYVRCAEDITLILTMTVGKTKKGPIRTEFTRSTTKGLPEFCNLRDQLAEDQDDLEVRLGVQNPGLEREEMNTTLYI